MKRGLVVAAAVLGGASVAIAGGSKLIRNAEGKGSRQHVNVPAAGDLPTGRAVGASPALYLSPGTQLATRASLDLGPAIPALRAVAGRQATLVFDQERGHVVRAIDIAAAAPFPGLPAESALEFLRAHREAFGLPALPEESWLGDEVVGADGERHYALQQHADDGVPLYGAIVTIHVDALGAPYLVQSEADPAPSCWRPKVIAISSADAIARAGGITAMKAGASVDAALWYFRPEGEGTYRLAWRVDAGADRSFIDAATGALLERTDRRCYANGTGDVWDPNPLTGGPNGTGVGGGTYSATSTSDGATLTGLTAVPNGVGILNGSICNVVDNVHGRAGGGGTDGIDFEGYNPNPGASPTNAQGQEEFFEQISVYFYVATTSDTFVRLGNTNPKPLDTNQVTRFYPIKVNLDIATQNNAFFDPSDRSLQIGDGIDNQIANLQKDIDVTAHEFGHFIELTYAPDQAPRLNSPRRAMGEGFGDFTAATVNGAQTARGGQPGALCFADATLPLGGGVFTCLRTYNLGALKQNPQSVQNEEHADGEIICGALFKLADLEAGGGLTQASLEEAFRCLLAGYGNLPRSNAQWSDLVDAMIAGDQHRTGGAHASNITTAFATVGIAGKKAAPSTSTQNVTPREILLGVPFDEAFTANNQLKRYFVRVPTSTATHLVVRVDSPGLATLSQLYVAPNNYTSATDVVKSIDSASGSRDVQLIEVTSSEAVGYNAAGVSNTAATCRINDDVFWLIDVVAVNAGTFHILASDANPAAVQPVDLGTFTGGTLTPPQGSIPAANTRDVDLYFFEGTKDQIVKLKVVGDTSLDPTVWLFDTSLHVLAADIDGEDSDADSDGNDDNEATVAGQPLPSDGTYIIAVTGYSSEAGQPVTSGNYQLTVSQGVLPGTPIARNPSTNTFTAATGSVHTGEDVVFNVQIDTTVNRLRIKLSPTGPSTPNDIDLLVARNTGSNVEADFFSLGNGANEQVVISTGTNPSIRSSDFWFIVVRGYDVSVPTTASAQPFKLELFANESTGGGGGGGGGCSVSAPRGALEGAGFWLPTAAALLGLAVASRRRRLAPSGVRS